MTSDQQFLKSVAIRPDDPVKEQWMEWRTDEIAAVRLQNAELVRQLHNADQRAIKDRNTINMYKLGTIAGFFLAFLIGMQGKW